MKTNEPLDTAAVAAFVVTTRCDIPLYVNLFILRPYMDDVTFAELQILVMKYYWTRVNHSQVLESPWGHALAGRDMGGNFDMALVSHGQSLLQCPFCIDVIYYHMFQEYPRFVATVEAVLAYRTSKVDHTWNPDRQEFKDAHQNIAKAHQAKSTKAPVKPGRRHTTNNSPLIPPSASKTGSAQATMVAKPGRVHATGTQHQPSPMTSLPVSRQQVHHATMGH